MSEAWQVILTREPKKTLRKVPADLRQRLLAALRGLETEPRPHGCKMLTGYDLYSLRVGGWRIIYRLLDDRLVVLVVTIAPRGEAYRDLR